MLEIQLNEHSAEDMKAIEELRMKGVPEEVIQMGYDNTQKKRAGIERINESQKRV